ncbi:MAG: helix-hairpin-helix domain-containing protein [Candidatus Shapirobacteria bacterium]
MMVQGKLKKLNWVDLVLVAGIGLILVGIGINVREQKRESKVELLKVQPTGVVVVQSNNEVMIDIEGEVIKPGVYKMAKGSRMGEVLVAAGGLAAGADREWVEKNINKAEIVKDGMKIYIPSKGEEALVLGSESSGLININTAGMEELDKLPGVGPGIAQKIIDYRQNNAGFRDINEIKLVSGIGEKLFLKIKDQISL